MGFVANGTDHPVLPALRGLLQEADDALLGVAFVDQRGILLIANELRRLGNRARLVATTSFGGDRARGALHTAAGLGVRCRVLNPGRGTFHPKVVVVSTPAGDRALVGSANLTSGLVVNVEACQLVQPSGPDIRSAAESWWADGVDLAELRLPHARDVFELDLWRLLKQQLAPGDVVRTLGSNPRPNLVVSLERTGVLVETEASRRKGSGPQLIEPRMVQIAWDVLLATGRLTNQQLLKDLRVHRSSFVCGLLATLPGVDVVPGRTITLATSSVSARSNLRLAAEEAPSWPAVQGRHDEE